MPIVRLSDRATIRVSGQDAEHLLQNIVTTDLDTLTAGEARAGALLAPQGKILFDFLISRDGADGFRLDCRADVADDLLRRLILYRLRAKAEIIKDNQTIVAVAWENDSPASQIDPSTRRLRDSRFKTIAVERFYVDGAPPASDDLTAWTLLRIEHGVAESGTDYALGDAFPHDVLLDEIGGVGFGKGCYVGQEVVSRMQHRGTARRRVLLVRGDAPLPPSGTPLTASGRELGSLGSVVGGKALAIARIDRVKDAIDAQVPILAGDEPVVLAIPAWAKFTYPTGTAAESA